MTSITLAIIISLSTCQTLYNQCYKQIITTQNQLNGCLLRNEFLTLYSLPYQEFLDAAANFGQSQITPLDPKQKPIFNNSLTCNQHLEACNYGLKLTQLQQDNCTFEPPKR